MRLDEVVLGEGRRRLGEGLDALDRVDGEDAERDHDGRGDRRRPADARGNPQAGRDEARPERVDECDGGAEREEDEGGRPALRDGGVRERVVHQHVLGGQERDRDARAERRHGDRRGRGPARGRQEHEGADRDEGGREPAAGRAQVADGREGGDGREREAAEGRVELLGRRAQEERERERHEDREAVPVLHRVAEPAEGGGEELRHVPAREDLGEAAARGAEEADRGDPEREAVEPAAHVAARGGADGDHEDPDVERDPVELGEGALGALGPGDRRAGEHANPTRSPPTRYVARGGETSGHRPRTTAIRIVHQTAIASVARLSRP